MRADAVGEDEKREREKRKDVPCLTTGTLLREMPSFMGTPWPSALGRREWVRWGRGVCAGDCERGVGAALFCGGPFAQADREGSCVVFGADAVEDLLILRGLSKCRAGGSVVHTKS